MKRSLSVLASAILAASLLGQAPAAGVDEEPGPDCVVSWGSAARQESSSFSGVVTNARVGRQDCYDRFVVDVSGSAGGYDVAYVDAVRAPGSGLVVPLRGEAALRVIVRAPAHDDDGQPTYNPPVPGEVADVAAYETFEQVAFAGTFEGSTTFGLGVRERLPFRVFALDGPGEGSRLVIDVAHAWLGTGSPSASPFGNYESARAVPGGVEVKGWTIDPDTTGPIYVWVTVDGVGRHLYANGNRPDVGAVHPAYGPGHGLSLIHI